MAFDPEPTQVRTPTKIQALVIILHRSWQAGEEEPINSAKFKIIVHDQDGAQMTERAGPLAPHNSPQENAALLAFMDTKWAQVEAEVLP